MYIFPMYGIKSIKLDVIDFCQNVVQKFTKIQSFRNFNPRALRSSPFSFIYTVYSNSSVSSTDIFFLPPIKTYFYSQIGQSIWWQNCERIRNHTLCRPGSFTQTNSSLFYTRHSSYLSQSYSVDWVNFYKFLTTVPLFCDSLVKARFVMPSLTE